MVAAGTNLLQFGLTFSTEISSLRILRLTFWAFHSIHPYEELRTCVVRIFMMEVLSLNENTTADLKGGYLRRQENDESQQ